jgi:hypothetical protein
MGILADLFVATEQDARDYESSMLEERDGHDEKYQPAQYKSLTTLEFGMLWALLERKDWDVNRHMLEPVAQGEEAETWLERFQPGFVDLLTTLSDQRLEEVAAQWAATEELDGWEQADTEQVLVDLRRLAQEASGSGRGLYLWGSL